MGLAKEICYYCHHDEVIEHAGTDMVSNIYVSYLVDECKKCKSVRFELVHLDNKDKN
jgi:hypothetical protein